MSDAANEGPSSFTYAWPRPAVTVDCVVFGFGEDGLSVLLVRRGEEPFVGQWALPGGFVREKEGLEDAARRELDEETGLTLSFLEQLYTFGAPARDPRGRVITVAFYALVKELAQPPLRATGDAAAAKWFSEGELPDLAFDHGDILGVARERLRGKVRWQPIGFELLPELFTLSALQTLYEVVLERQLDKRNFRRKVLSLGILEETQEMRRGPGRPARLYRFDKDAYARAEADGFVFEL
ncbi:MAG: NUDIX hydrolase [Deltaproteobacteria bacterium]|nr:NUDIX hydrolase [Deltaproteobacteria bacterium]